MAKKPKSPQKPTPSMTGTGMVRKAADALRGRARKTCEATGGSYDPSTGRCK